MSFDGFVALANQKKPIFTPGPASLLAENLSGLGPCFGRGDTDYDSIEQKVLGFLREASGQDTVARFQGSGSLALEMLALNFLQGHVVVVDTGYYSERLRALANSASRRLGQVSAVSVVPSHQIADTSMSADWVWACPVETSIGLRVDIQDLADFSQRSGARLALDATASIGLEPFHELADVVAFSSCKGLFGLTGAAFLAFSTEPQVEVDSFYLSVASHLEKKMTGPYHSIQSLSFVADRHDELKQAVVKNKAIFLERFADYIVHPAQNQPLLCTMVSRQLMSSSGKSVMYEPRGVVSGSVVSHLGEVHLGQGATGQIIEDLVLAI